MGFTHKEIMFGVVGIVIIIIISCIISSTINTGTTTSKTVSITKTPDSDITINNSSKRFEESSQTSDVSSSNIINL